MLQVAQHSAVNGGSGGSRGISKVTRSEMNSSQSRKHEPTNVHAVIHTELPPDTTNTAQRLTVKTDCVHLLSVRDGRAGADSAPAPVRRAPARSLLSSRSYTFVLHSLLAPLRPAAISTVDSLVSAPRLLRGRGARGRASGGGGVGAKAGPAGRGGAPALARSSPRPAPPPLPPPAPPLSRAQDEAHGVQLRVREHRGVLLGVPERLLGAEVEPVLLDNCTETAAGRRAA